MAGAHPGRAGEQHRRTPRESLVERDRPAQLVLPVDLVDEPHPGSEHLGGLLQFAGRMRRCEGALAAADGRHQLLLGRRGGDLAEIVVEPVPEPVVGDRHHTAVVFT